MSDVVPERLVRTCTNFPTPVRSTADSAGLRDCGKIVGDLHLFALGLTTIDLPWLRKVTGTLNLLHLSELQSLSGLARLEDVRDLHLEGLTQLSNLDGLERLVHLDGLTLRRLTGLASLDGMHLLSLVHNLNVADNAVLQDISGLAVSSPFFYSAGFSAHPLLCEAHVQAVFATIAHDELGTRANLGVCP